MQLTLELEPATLRVAVLGSGSAGNAVVVESGSRRLLLDAGFSCRELERRLKGIGLHPGDVDAVVLTHEHQDHVRGAARFARRHQVTVWATRGTLEAMAPLHPQVATRVLASGVPVLIETFEVVPFAVPHDAREPIGLVIEDAGGRRLGLVADLGCRSRLAWGHLRDLDALLLETNHDLEMLRSGPYPWPLKQRVAGSHGHLSNRDAAEGLEEALGDRLRWVVAYHLSRTNNHPEIVFDELAGVLTARGARTEICLTAQNEPTPWLTLASRQRELLGVD